jgi:membrane fusion protein, epimerase transport system
MTRAMTALAPDRSRHAGDSAEAAGRAGWRIIALFFCLFGSWSLVAPLDSAVVAPAVVKVEGNRKPVQHPEGGIVKQLLVKEGGTVSTGDVLVLLDGLHADTEFDVLDQFATALLLTEARLHAEQAGSEALELPPQLTSRRGDPAVAATWRGQQTQLASRRQEEAGQAHIVAQRIAQLEAQQAGARAQIDGLDNQRASMRSELDSLAPLLERGIVTRTRLLQLERSIAALDGQAGEARAATDRYAQAIIEQRQIEVQSRTQRATAIGQELRDVQMRLAEVLPKLAQARSVRERSIVRAPYAGRVVGLAVFAVGAVVGRGEKLMDIVPDEGALAIEARIAVEDIAEVYAGGPAEVRLTGFKQQSTPTLRAEVVSVSADRLIDPRTGQPYFSADIRIADGELEAMVGVRLQPGLSATVQIPTAPRTLFQYLVGPLTQSFAAAMRER